MAKTIATFGGIALAPGVSLNRRLYTRDAVARMVTRAQERIKSGDMPLTIMTHHAADDSSDRIVGRITAMSLDEDGNARYQAAVADTPHGRTIASLLDTSDGQPAFLRNGSIRGYWMGTVRKVKGPDGSPVETADDLALDGFDMTKSPGVSKAGVDAFAWAERSGRTETTERVPLTESVQEARVTITEDTAPAEGQKSCAEMGHQCCRGTAESADAKTDAPAGTTYADPGYLKDGKKRYPLNSAKRIRAAWSYINQKDNAAQYTAQQLKRIKAKIKSAMKGIGATIAAEGLVIWPANSLAEADADLAGLTEYAGGMDGSFSVCATNGPLNVSVSSYCVDPADLDLILRAAAAAACAAMKTIDPDMDGDMDVPGADSEDTDNDMESAPAASLAEDAPADDVTETTTDPAPDPAAEPTETEMPAMTDTATPAAEATPAAAVTTTLETAQAGVIGMSPDQFSQLLAAVRPPATEAAPATEIPATATTPAATDAASPVAETAEQRMERLSALAEQKVADAAKAAGIQLQETDEQILDRLIEAKLTPLRQAAAEAGHGVQRSGFTTGRVNENVAPSMTGGVQVNEHGMPAGSPNKPLHEYSDEELARYGHPLLVGHALGDRAAKLG